MTQSQMDSMLAELAGYRGKPGAHVPAIIDAVLAVQAYVVAHQDAISEVEINPLICTTTSAIAVDAHH